jgi:cobalt-zinc-cadmium efflux system membrane fusion protein
MYITGHFHTDANYTRTLPEDAIVKDGIKSFIFVRDSELSPENESHGIDEQTSQIERKDDEGQKSEKNNENAINNELGFRMVEVITGQKDEGYIEIHLLDSMPENTQVVMNAAYYLLAEMKKEETGDDH